MREEILPESADAAVLFADLQEPGSATEIRQKAEGACYRVIFLNQCPITCKGFSPFLFLVPRVPVATFLPDSGILSGASDPLPLDWLFELELAIALAKGQVSRAQVNAVLGRWTKNSASYYCWLARTFRDAVRSGELVRAKGESL